MSENYDLPVSALKQENVDPEGILAFIDRLKEKNIRLHSFVLVRNGNIICSIDAYPYSSSYRHIINSCTKTFTSLAMGILYDKGLIDFDDKVNDYIKSPNAEKNGLGDLTIRHLITMSVGHDQEPNVDRNKEWALRLFDKPATYKAGTRFFYNNLASNTLSTIVTKVTGKTTEELLKECFFDRCGIHDYYWLKDPFNISLGAAGIYMKATDVAKLGQLFLNKGVLNGERIVSEEYIEMATSKQFDTAPFYAANKSESIQGYGFHLWRSSHDAYRASGLFGQVCLVIPDRNIVAVFNSATSGSQPILDAFFDTVYPAIDREGTYPEDIENIIKEKAKLLDLGCEKSCAEGIYEKQISGRKLVGRDRDKSITLKFEDDVCTFTIKDKGEYVTTLKKDMLKEDTSSFDEYLRSRGIYKECEGRTGADDPLTYGTYSWLSNTHLKIMIVMKDSTSYMYYDLYFDDEYVKVFENIEYLLENQDCKDTYVLRMPLS